MTKTAEKAVVKRVAAPVLFHSCINCTKNENHGTECRSYGFTHGSQFRRRLSGKCAGFISANITV